MTNIAAIDKNVHKHTKIKPDNCYGHSKNRHFTVLTVQEFVPASQDFPILFIKNSETGQISPIALFGFKQEQNLFYSPDGWQGMYVPRSLALYPFMLHQPKDSDDAILCFDQASDLVNDEEGHALFDESGEQTDWLRNHTEQVVRHVENNMATVRFVKMLTDYELLSAKTLNLKLANGEEISLTGLYAIDEQKLNALPSGDFEQLRQTGALPAIYASLLSMQKIQSLIVKHQS